MSRRILRTLSCDAYYDPQTMYTRLPKLVDETRLSVASEYEIELAGQHECQHWRQSLGTSIGQFICRLRDWQTRSLFRNIWADDKMSCQQIFDRRSRDGEFAIIPITEPSSIGKNIFNGNSSMQFQIRMWVEYEVLVLLLTRPEDQKFLRFPNLTKATVFGDASGDIFLDQFSEFAKCGESELREIRQWFVPMVQGKKAVGSIDLWHDLNFDDGNIETDDLMECGATLAHQMHLNEFGDPRLDIGFLRIFDQSRDQLLNTRYGRPLRMFFKLWNHSTSNEDAIYRLVSLIIDIALNPPVAPFVNPATFEQGDWNDWRQIYPPARFMLLAYGANRIGHVIEKSKSDIEIFEFSKELCFVSGIIDPNQYIRQPAWISSMSSLNDIYGMADMLTFSRTEFIEDMRKRMFGLRACLPRIFYAPSDVFLNAIEYDCDRYMKMPAFGSCFGSPHFWIGDRHYRQVIDRNVSGMLVSHAILDNLVFQIFCQRGTLSLESFPSEIWSDPRFVNDLIASLDRIFPGINCRVLGLDKRVGERR